jgi:uncharacterized metal-binding protein
MPKSHTHEKWALLFSIPLSYIYFKLSGNLIASIIFFVSFIFGVFMLSPDLDTKSKSYSRWGVLRFIWLPYRKIMKHRSIFSHLPFVGTLIRTSYLVISITLMVCLIIYAMLFILGIKTHQNIFLVIKNSLVMTFRVILQIKRDYIIAAILGISMGDLIHYILDVFASYLKNQS